MKNALKFKPILYTLVKYTIKTALHCYYKRIVVVGKENIPLETPVLFLPNHQSALLDVLLIATDCNRKPYFLTRADVFNNAFLNWVFSYFRMLPIYRLRDGRKTLAKNDAVFDACAEIFANQQALVMFPEANHNLKRRVRPLSKGFTRILERGLMNYPDLDIQIVPVGLNYQSATRFPDEVSVYYGKAISVKEMYDEDEKVFVERVKERVTTQLKTLTTHIEDLEHYDQMVNQLEVMQVDFLRPQETNRRIAEMTTEELNPLQPELKPERLNLWSGIFNILNMPMILLWRHFILPKIKEAEFIDTFRFAFGLLIFPLYEVLLYLLISVMTNTSIALFVVLGLIVFNLLYIKNKKRPVRGSF